MKKVRDIVVKPMTMLFLVGIIMREAMEGMLKTIDEAKQKITNIV